MAEQFIIVTDIAKGFVKRAKQDKDVALAITGYEGDGKSMLAGNITLEILRNLGKTEEEITAQFDSCMIYSPNKEEMHAKITAPEKYLPINSDEAIKALYKLNWASTSQKYLNMLFSLCRKENKINILCIPRFSDLNEFFRNHRIMYWIHILERSTAILMVKDWNPFCKDPWHLDINNKLVEESARRKKINDFNIEEKIRLMEKTRNFVSIVHFEDMENKYKKIYREGKYKSGYEDMDQVKSNVSDTSDRTLRWKKQRDDAYELLLKSGRTKKELVTLLGVSRDTIYTPTHKKLFGVTNNSIVQIAANTRMNKVIGIASKSLLINNHPPDDNLSKSPTEDNKEQ